MRSRQSIDLQSLVDTHEKPFVVIDRNFKIVAVNSAYERCNGASVDHMLGRTCYQVSHHRDQPCFESGEECPYQHIFEQGRQTSCLHVHYDDLGRSHRVRINAYPLQGSEGELYLGEVIEELSEPEGCHGRQFHMVGISPVFLAVLEQLKQAAGSDAPLLLEGETGTGKDLAANFIHRYSRRCEKPFLTLDCTVLTESLFEAEVFGYERGAFTGSVGEKEGLFELVDGGTLFLDEIGDIPASLQAKLLRVLETGQYRRVGGRRTLHTNARIICATNRNLGLDVEAGVFREDLYYRVACLHIRLPGLSERLQDIPVLAEALLARMSQSNGKHHQLGQGSIEALQAYNYPGNIRELRNILSVAAARTAGDKITAHEITAVIKAMQSRRQAQQESKDGTLAQAHSPRHAAGLQPRTTHNSLDDIESQHIKRLLAENAGNRRRTAEALGISERTMYRKLKRYDLN